MFEEVSPKYSRPNSGRFFDNPSQSLTSIDDIQEHEPVKKREKSKNPFAKSARNTVIGTPTAKNNNISSVEGDLDQLRVAKLAQDNRILTDKLKSRVSVNILAHALHRDHMLARLDFSRKF